MNTEKQAFQMQSVRTVFLFHLLQGCFFFIRYTRPASNRHQQCIAKLERLGRVKWRQKTLSVLIWRRFRQSAGSCSDRLISAEKAFFLLAFSLILHHRWAQHETKQSEYQPCEQFFCFTQVIF